MKKHSIITMITFFTIMLHNPSNGMFRNSRFKFNKDSFKRTFFHICDIANVGISVCLPVGLSIQGLRNTKKSDQGTNTIEAPQNVQKFVLNELEKIGVKNAQEVKVRFSAENPMPGSGSTDGSTIFLSPGFTYFINNKSEIEDLLDEQTKIESLKAAIEKKKHTNCKKNQVKANVFNNMSATHALKKRLLTKNGELINEATHHLTKAEDALRKELNMYRFTIQHEGNHIKNNDIRNRSLTHIAVPLAVYSGEKLIQAFRNAPRSTPGIAKSALLIPYGFAKLKLLLTIFEKHSQSIEQRADDQVMNDVGVLEGGLTYFKRAHTQDFEQYKAEMKAKNIQLTDETLKKEFENRMAEHDSSHPPLLERIQKIESRIALLQAKK